MDLIDLLLLLLLVQTVNSTCATDLDCSLNGVCTAVHGNAKICLCDPAWAGSQCGDLSFAPSPNASTPPSMGRKPLCVYHGDDNTSYSWGASVQFAAEDQMYYMWVAEMTEHCTISEWRTNSEVQLAYVFFPVLLMTETSNPQHYYYRFIVRSFQPLLVTTRTLHEARGSGPSVGTQPADDRLARCDLEARLHVRRLRAWRRRSTKRST